MSHQLRFSPGKREKVKSLNCESPLHRKLIVTKTQCSDFDSSFAFQGAILGRTTIF